MHERGLPRAVVDVFHHRRKWAVLHVALCWVAAAAQVAQAVATLLQQRQCGHHGGLSGPWSNPCCPLNVGSTHVVPSTLEQPMWSPQRCSGVCSPQPSSHILQHGASMYNTTNSLYQDCVLRYAWNGPSGCGASPPDRPLTAPPTIGDGSPSGSYYWNSTTCSLVVKLVGQSSVEIRDDPVRAGTFHLLISEKTSKKTLWITGATCR